MAAATLDDVDAHLRAIISNLYYLLVQAHEYQGSGTQQAMTAEIKSLVQNLLHLSKTARRLPQHIPIELIQYVEETRNPDIYTREFVELVMRYNQQQKGRSEAFGSFRDILAESIAVGIPDLKQEVEKVVPTQGERVND